MHSSSRRAAGPDDLSRERSAPKVVDLVHAYLSQGEDVAWVKDEEFRYRFVNPAFERLFGKSATQVLGREDREFMPREKALVFREQDQQVLDSGASVKAVAEIADANGVMRSWAVTVFPLRQADGSVWIAGKATDHTESLAAEVRLRGSEENHRLLVENSPFCIHRIDRGGHLTSMNRAGLKMIGETDAQCIIGVPYCDAVCDEDRPRIAKLMEEAFHGRFSEFEFRGAGGQYFRSNFVPIRDEAGNIDSLLGITEEISDRKEAERKLRDSEERYRLVARATRDPIWEIDMVSGTVRWNDAYDRLLGTRPEATSESWDWWIDRIHEDERGRVAESLRQALADPASDHWSEDYHIRGADGEELLVQDRAFIGRNPDGKPIRIVGTMRDQTPTERAMKEREQLIHDVQEAQRLESLGVLAGGIAHDFNNLLASILGNVSLVRCLLGEDSEHNEVLHDAELAVDRAADLCQQMLAYAGQGRCVLTALDLSKQIEEMTKLIRVSVGTRASLHLNLEPQLPSIRGDRSQISQVIMNLILNAAEAMTSPDGSITVTTGQCRLDTRSPQAAAIDPPLDAGLYVYLDVRDTGSGMNADTLRRIFEPFYSTKFTGRGLGLAAVQGIVRSHQGGLSVASRPGAGSTFRAYLPAKDHPSSPGTDPATSPTKENFKRNAKILLVDDESSVRAAALRILNHHGLGVVAAANGREALEQFRSQPDFDLVVLDLTMPEMDGLATFEAIRKLSPEVPILLASGHNQRASLKRFEGLDIAGFLQKPFRSSDLLRAIQESLA